MHRPRIPTSRTLASRTERPAARFRALASVLVIAGIALGCGSPKSTPEEWSIQERLAERLKADTRVDSFTLRADRGRVLGNATVPVWVVIASDFQCPKCKEWHDEVFSVLRKDYVETGRVRMAYVNMPQPEHLNAMASAIAGGCASVQGKFWETYEKIFATQRQWEDLPDARPFLDSLAIAAGADAGPLRLCTERALSTKLVRTDMARSKAAGVESLPTFFIGTHKLVGPTHLAEFRAVVELALAGK